MKRFVLILILPAFIRWYDCEAMSAGDSMESDPNGSLEISFPSDAGATVADSNPTTARLQNISFQNRYFDGPPNPVEADSPYHGVGWVSHESLLLLAKLTVRDNGGVSDSLEYGTIPGATDGIDPQFGEEELPPPPPIGVFDVRWKITGTQGVRRDIRDTLGGMHRQITYTGVMQPGAGGYPFHLRWNRMELPAGTLTLRYGWGGIFSVDMKDQDSLVISDEGTPQFQIVYDAGNILKLTLRDNGGYAGTLEYGTSEGATDGIDPQFGEEELPPPPPIGVFDVRWKITGTQGMRRDIRDTLGGMRRQITYTGVMQPGAGGYPFHLRWNRTKLPAGTFTLRYGYRGVFSVDMKDQDSLVISDEGTPQFQIVYDAGNILKLILQDHGGYAGTLEYGTGEGATDGIDPQFGEEELPPPPPIGVFDVRWKITGTQGVRRDIRDTLGGMHRQVRYTGVMQPGAGGYPFHLRWNRMELPAGTLTLRYGWGGIFSVDMREQDSLMISDEGTPQFQIVYDAGNILKLTLRDNGGYAGTLEYGTSEGATDGIDPQFGEEELPPPPPTGVFDVRWQIAGTQGSDRDIRDTLGGARTRTTYRGLLQPGSGGYPFHLKWNSQDLPSGTFTMRDAPSGVQFSVDMKQQDSLVITNPDISSFQVIYDRRPALYCTIRQGWNLISLPLTVDDGRKTWIFPGSTSNAFAFIPGGYVVRDTLQEGIGYWLRFPSAQNMGFTGTFRNLDTIAVGVGWNMIGAISDSVQVITIRQIPPTIIASQFYGYDGSYSGTMVLLPSRGYWVKTIAPGQLILSTGQSLNKIASSHSPIVERAAAIRICDSKAAKQALLFTSESIDQKELDFYELPPQPPAGIFDARFETNRMLESLNDGGQRSIAIQVSYAQYPLTISWDLKDQLVTTSLVVGAREVKINGQGSVTISDPTAPISLKLGSRSSLPKQFTLDQNYPNPFNPSTTIHYGLPHSLFVTLTVYNTLGQQVAQLVNEQQQAGYHDVVFRGDGLASGVYFYRIQAGGFTSVRRLLLLR